MSNYNSIYRMYVFINKLDIESQVRRKLHQLLETYDDLNVSFVKEILIAQYGYKR